VGSGRYIGVYVRSFSLAISTELGWWGQQTGTTLDAEP
jgi:hypothetical protein